MNKKTVTNTPSSRSVSVRDIMLFLLRPILCTGCRPQGRSDEAGVRAFTLIELLVVVLIIGILSAIALPQYQKAVDRARASELIIQTRHIKDLQEAYYLANGQYAANCEELAMEIPGGYELDENKYIVNQDKAIQLDCNRAGTSDDVRSAAIYKIEGIGFLSIEMKFANHPTRANEQMCYSTVERFQAVCKNMCGTSELTRGGGNACVW